MDLSRPYAVVSPTLEGEILATLARTERPLTGREVARLGRQGSQTGVHRALQRLVSQGLVLEQQAGRAKLFRLNREHLAAPAVEVLASIRENLLARLKAELQAWKLPAHHASLFGSAARGDGGVDSDIDLFIVRPRAVEEGDPTWRGQLEQLAKRVQAWTGNPAALAEVSEQEVAVLRKRRPAVVNELEKDAIDLYGPPVKSLFARRR